MNALARSLNTGLQAADRAMARLEARLTVVLVGTLCLVLAAGVVARYIGRPLVWVDELSILLMAAACFTGASALLAQDGHVGVSLAVDRLPPGLRFAAGVMREATVLAVAAVVAVLVWRWFGPLEALRAAAGRGNSGLPNFMHSEPTATLGVLKLWFWLALPLASLGWLLHGSARLARRIAGRPC